MELIDKKCVPCEGGTPTLSQEESEKLLKQIPGWTLKENKIYANYRFKDFKQAVDFINKMARVAEAEGHHPDFCVHYNKIDITLWTHAIGGLSENDFILAAKLNALKN
jgi:4a-hydroxytetrahydrobiopterin dehydratase